MFYTMHAYKNVRIAGKSFGIKRVAQQHGAGNA
jgi:hypothetical protein